MAKLVRLLPFGCMPGSWGLKGKTRAIASAEYYYSLYDLEVELAYIEYRFTKDYEVMADKTLQLALNDIKLKYDKVSVLEHAMQAACYETDVTKRSKMILDAKYKSGEFNEFTYDMKLADLITDDTARKIAQTEANFKHGIITELERDRNIASCNNIPWVDVPTLDFDIENPSNGAMELDWNDAFVELLREKGYSGTTDDIVVDMWFSELCKNIALETYSGVGDFDERVTPMKTRLDEHRWEQK